MQYKYLFTAILFSLCCTNTSFAQLRAKVFKDHCYAGGSQSLYGNSYYKSQLYIGNDKISSIIVNPGWAVNLYQHDNFFGRCYRVTSNMNDLKSINFGDEVSSMIVKSITPYPPVNYNTEHVLPNQFLNSTKLTKEIDRRVYLNKNLHPMLHQVSKIHSQGFAWDDITGNFVYTGCKSGSGGGCQGESYIVLYDQNLTDAIDVVVSEKYNGLQGDKSHPSSIQVTNQVFPVAIARDNHETTFIEFYRVNPTNIQYLGASRDITVTDVHIGALAYANINGNTYMVGGTWDSDQLVIWKASGVNRTSGFVHQKTITPHPAYCGVDQNWGKYNSLWLGKMKNGRIVLMASHGKFNYTSAGGWVDLWEINTLDKGKTTTLTKIHLSKTNNFIKSHFYEGSTFGPNNRVYSAPFDYKDYGYNTLSMSAVFSHRYTYRSCTYGNGTNSFSAQQNDGTNNELDLKNRNQLNNLALKQNNTTTQGDVIRYFPNPFQDQVQIDLSNFNYDLEDAFLNISDLNGRVIRSMNLKDLELHDSQLNLDVRNLQAGVYFFTLQTSSYHSTKKLIKLNP